MRVLESGQTLELESKDYFLKISVLEETNDFKIAFKNKRDNRPAIYDSENFIFSGRKYMANVKTVFIDWFTEVSDTLEWELKTLFYTQEKDWICTGNLLNKL